MPAVRSFSAEVFKVVHDTIAPSVVQLAIFGNERLHVAKEGEAEPMQLGTGLVLACTPEYIGIITTISCDPKEGYSVVARFDDQNNLEAKVVMRSGSLFGLVIWGPDLKAIPCTAACFYEGDPLSSAPVFAVGCQGITKEMIIVSGMISVAGLKMWVRGKEVWTLVHTCPIGDGLIGAPIVNQGGDVIGINVARTPQTSQINYALKMEELRNMLAGLVGAKLEPETRIAGLLRLFSEKISRFGSTKGKRGAKRKLSHTSRE